MNAKTENRVRLLIITPSLECGGSEKFVSQVCNHIDNGRFAVCLVVVDNTSPFHEINNAAVEIIDLKKDRVLFSLTAIKKVVNKFKPDIIFSTASHLNLYLAIFRKQFDATIKFVAREASIVTINSRQAKMPVLYSWLIKRFYKRFDIVICQSAYMQQDLVKNYSIDAGKTIVIRNAIEENSGSESNSEIKRNDGVYKFLTVARLSEEKGIERLIHAAGLLSISFKYYIIGEGNKLNVLQKLINNLQLQDKVFLKGIKRDPFSGMEDTDLFLLGSYYEGFPNVLLEAGAHGIPVVAFNVPGGIAEIIADNENGLLVNDADPIAFAATINDAIGADFNREKIIENTKKRFSVNNMMHAVEGIFLKLPQINN
ncbi:MAG: glycosyltransferase [Ferruginibacter sp.]